MELRFSMNRSESREKAFLLLFESSFKSDGVEEIIESARIDRNEKISNFTIELFRGTTENLTDIDIYIEKYLKGWEKNRLSRVVISILRLAVFEMIYQKEVPVSVSINEAVELAKKYGYGEDSSYINGVLGSLSKEIAKKDKENQILDKI